MKNNNYLEYILDLFSEQDGISYRSMFGGYGIYKYKVIFAIIIKKELYFKVDNTNKEQYIQTGSKPFTYIRDNREYSMSYWLVPGEILEDEDQLKIWLNQSYQISLEGKQISQRKSQK